MNLELLPREKLETIKKYLDAQKILTSRESFIYFVTQVWPDFVYRKGTAKRTGATINWSLTSLTGLQTVRLNDSS